MIFFLHLPKKMEPIEGSETSAFKPQTPGKFPKENVIHYDILTADVGCHIGYGTQPLSLHSLWLSGFTLS